MKPQALGLLHGAPRLAASRLAGKQAGRHAVGVPEYLVAFPMKKLLALSKVTSRPDLVLRHRENTAWTVDCKGVHPSARRGGGGKKEHTGEGWGLAHWEPWAEESS